MIIAGHHVYKMTPSRHLSSFPVLSGMSDHAITDYDVIIHVLSLKQNPTDKIGSKWGFRGVKKANFGRKGMKLFLSVSRKML